MFRISVISTHLLIALLGAATTVVLGISRAVDEVSPPLEYLHIATNDAIALAIIFGGVIAFLAAMEAFFDHSSLWRECSKIRRGLEALERTVVFSFDKPCALNEAEKVEIKKLFDDFAQIMSEYNETWIQAQVGQIQTRTSSDHASRNY